MFNLSYLVACSVTFYIYGNQEDIGSFILSAFLLLNSLITIVIFIKFNVYFQRFRYTFRPSSLTFLHYIFHIQCIVLSIVMMIVLKDYPWVPFVPQIILFIYTIVNKPYNYLQENIRSCFNLLVMMAVTSMIVFGFYIDDVTYTSMNSYIYPMII